MEFFCADGQLVGGILAYGRLVFCGTCLNFAFSFPVLPRTQALCLDCMITLIQQQQHKDRLLRLRGQMQCCVISGAC